MSAADGTGGQMRTADGMYIYNFTTKPLTANRDYALRVKLGSHSGPIIAEAGAPAQETSSYGGPAMPAL